MPLSSSWFAQRRARARRVRRTVRHVDPWSVFKISVFLYLCLYVAVMIAGVLLWSAAVGSGLIDNIESFIEELLALETYEFQADEIFRGAAIIGLVLAAAGAAFSVVLAILFNLISDLTGGVRVTVLEEDEAVPLAEYQQYAAELARRQAGLEAQAQDSSVPPTTLPPAPERAGMNGGDVQVYEPALGGEPIPPAPSVPTPAAGAVRAPGPPTRPG